MQLIRRSSVSKNTTKQQPNSKTKNNNNKWKQRPSPTTLSEPTPYHF